MVMVILYVLQKVHGIYEALIAQIAIVAQDVRAGFAALATVKSLLLVMAWSAEVVERSDGFSVKAKVAHLSSG